MRKRSAVRRLMLEAGLPEDALEDCARVTMTGRSAVLVEGQHGVIELGAERIRMRTGSGMVSVLGNGLRLRELSLSAALIEGEPLAAVTYEKA